MGYFHRRADCAKELLEEAKQLIEKYQKKYEVDCYCETDVSYCNDITLPDKYHKIYPCDESYLDVTIKIKIK